MTAAPMHMPAGTASAYRRCSISVMDTIADPDIRFDEQGISNYYYEYQQAQRLAIVPGRQGDAIMRQRYEEIKRAGKGKRYDCIIGLSGGIDSTYLCLQAARHGLRPLLVHCDNSWNSERAIHNMDRTVRAFGFDLHTQLIHWQEFRDLELAYLRASVVDIDILTDHAYVAVLYRLACKWRIRHILAGINLGTEQVLPSSWRHNSDDLANIRHIVKAYGGIDLRDMKSFPVQSYYDKFYCHHILGIRITHPFNYGDYAIAAVREAVMREVGWEPFEGKHFDSIWTRFYQSYILPVKFGIDKRKAHYSNLIFSGQMMREEALERLGEPAYPPALLKKDLAMFLRKMSLTQEQFDALLALPRQEHSAFAMQRDLAGRLPLLAPVIRMLKASRNWRGKAATLAAGITVSGAGSFSETLSAL